MSKEKMGEKKAWLVNVERCIAQRVESLPKCEPGSKIEKDTEAQLRKLKRIKKSIEDELDKLIEYDRMSNQMRDL